ncbi:hypothetical protein [Aestuariibacter salexigens]|uniref:hypothetical protein n=1 Tax=Aestuariibacter salexigens TaxID=226010 RepID=UPI000401C819|nr:hypothetical protein [Aestuariibacter salexigens]
MKWFVCFTLISVSHVVDASLIEGGFYGINSTFENNGDITVEYQNGRPVREWLDLTYTNGITFNFISADISGDGFLNGQVPNPAAVNTPSISALNSILSMNNEMKAGWNIASFQTVLTMVNEFFGREFTAGNVEVHGIDSMLESFILLFGDTLHNGYLESNLNYTDVNPELPNIGFARGMTSSLAKNINGEYEAKLVEIYDGQLIYAHEDSNQDRIITNTSFVAGGTGATTGTWLVRDVVNVSSPSTFTLMFFCLFASFFRKAAK